MEEYLLKWYVQINILVTTVDLKNLYLYRNDHHNSFFSIVNELCHQEALTDVTIAGEC